MYVQKIAYQGLHMRSRLWEPVISFISTAREVDMHYHHCFQIVVSLTHLYDTHVGDEFLTNQRGMIFNQGVHHACHDNKITSLVHFIEANSYLGWKLKSLLDGKPYLSLTSLLSDAQLEAVLPCNFDVLSNEELIPYVYVFLESIFSLAPGDTKQVMDDRMERALKYIDQNLERRLEVDTIAELMFLSPNRARHLFAEKTGMPFTQYVIWKRMKGVLMTALSGELSLVDACAKYGFSDQSHFNQRFKRILGMPPRAFFRDCRLLR